MNTISLGNDTFWVGINDRTTDLFEGLWPIERSGISYNSYIIKDKDTVLIDLSKDLKSEDYFEQINSVSPASDLRYAILNHMEPDHTGVLKILIQIAPQIEIICTPKAVTMLRDFYGLTANIRAVADGEKISIGNRELQFFHIPFVHWPETMVTYDTKSKVLYSCDAFGGYGALQGTLFDDECVNLTFYEEEALRYYANIVAKFSANVLIAIKKLSSIEIKTIAPSHGLVWRKNPGRIVDLYEKWAEYATTGGERSITLLYGSMYGNTEQMMNAVARGISDGGMHPEIFDVARTHSSYILASLWKSKGVVIGAPTYEVSLFPYMQQILEKATIKNVRNKKAVYFGSYGWSKGAYKKVTTMTEPLKWEMIDMIEFPGAATDEIQNKGYEMGKQFAEVIKNSDLQ